MIVAVELVGKSYVNVFNEHGSIVAQIMVGDDIVGQPQFNGNYVTITRRSLIDVYRVEDNGFCTRTQCLYR